VDQHFYVLPEFMYTMHEARTISHLVSRSSRGKVNDMVDMPLPVADQLRVGEGEMQVKKVCQSSKVFKTFSLSMLQSATICYNLHCVLNPKAWHTVLTIQERGSIFPC
jgi:hypothetical protein